jgi:hypothetical protein
MHCNTCYCCLIPTFVIRECTASSTGSGDSIRHCSARHRHLPSAAVRVTVDNASLSRLALSTSAATSLLVPDWQVPGTITPKSPKLSQIGILGFDSFTALEYFELLNKPIREQLDASPKTWTGSYHHHKVLLSKVDVYMITSCMSGTWLGLITEQKLQLFCSSWTFQRLLTLSRGNTSWK